MRRFGGSRRVLAVVVLTLCAAVQPVSVSVATLGAPRPPVVAVIVGVLAGVAVALRRLPPVGGEPGRIGAVIAVLRAAAAASLVAVAVGLAGAVATGSM